MSSVSASSKTTSKLPCGNDRLDPRIQLSLAQLPPDLRQLNRTYVSQVDRRSLISAAEASCWIGSQVNVFLRHDKVCVFAIVRENLVAMADFVTLADATFHVDHIGRSQSNAELGPLPNLRTVHAYLTGDLVQIADCGSLPDPDSWSSVDYNPAHNLSFVEKRSGVSVHSSAMVRMVPGAAKVWVPKQRELAQ